MPLSPNERGKKKWSTPLPFLISDPKAAQPKFGTVWYRVSEGHLLRQFLIQAIEKF